MVKAEQIFIAGPNYPDMFDVAMPVMLQAEAVCLGCQCSDNDACGTVEPCFWLMVNYEWGIGVCSECDDIHEECLFEHWETFLSNSRRIYCRRCRVFKTLFQNVVTAFGLVRLYACPECNDGVNYDY
ncbi:MAG: hypothetical protein GKR93_12095 [Gammaproteobacteria bacterium]|nr:hypothetical protein [Gammaproteobacteria bacterium]